MHYGTHPFMVSCKIQVCRNVWKIITGTCFQSHKNDILPYSVYFDEISYGWSLVIKLHCGENRSLTSATEFDLRLLIARTRQPWQKISPIFESLQPLLVINSAKTLLNTLSEDKRLLQELQNTSGLLPHGKVFFQQ